jgi:hypothetical protein
MSRRLMPLVKYTVAGPAAVGRPVIDIGSTARQWSVAE